MNAARQNRPSRFDPFTDRLSRDIRNGLSQAFVDSLAANDAQRYHQVARKWLLSRLPSFYTTYIRERLKRYDRIMAAGDPRPGPQSFAIALVIWNKGLFFEFHEYLETIWQHTSGDEHRALKGLIKAAGVYVHLENQNRPAALRLAPKARCQMEDNAYCLDFIANLEVLLTSLEQPDFPAPQLEYVERPVMSNR